MGLGGVNRERFPVRSGPFEGRIAHVEVDDSVSSAAAAQRLRALDTPAVRPRLPEPSVAHRKVRALRGSDAPSA